MKTENKYNGPFLTRKQAKVLVHEFYLMPSTCPHGHHCSKHAQAKDCRYCRVTKNNSEYNKQKRKELISRNPNYYSEYAKANATHRYEMQKRRYDQRSEAQRANARVDGRVNTAKWRQRHPEKNRLIDRNRKARMRGAEGTHTVSDIIAIRRFQGGNCAYFTFCGNSLSNGEHVDHAVPLARNGSNWPWNIQLCCAHCNLSKGARDPIEFLVSLKSKMAA